MLFLLCFLPFSVVDVSVSAAALGFFGAAKVDADNATIIIDAIAIFFTAFFSLRETLLFPRKSRIHRIVNAIDSLARLSNLSSVRIPEGLHEPTQALA